VGLYLIAGVLIALIVLAMTRGRTVAVGPDELRIRKRHGWLVVIASVLFAGWIVVFTFAYDNPFLGRDVPSWIHTVLAPFVGTANLLAIYGTPVGLALGLVAALSGRVPSRWLRLVLALYTVLYLAAAATVVIDAWFPRHLMGELSDLWLELLGMAVLGAVMFAALLFIAWRSRPQHQPL
jgi:hypothetical protein